MAQQLEYAAGAIVLLIFRVDQYLLSQTPTLRVGKIETKWKYLTNSKYSVKIGIEVIPIRVVPESAIRCYCG